MIQKSTEWPKVEFQILSYVTNPQHRIELRNMLKNVSRKVNDLSRAEVLERSGKRNLTALLLKDINDDIELIKEYILISKLYS